MKKMNFLYKTGFILLTICIPMLLGAIITAYLFEKTYFSAVFSVGGSFIAFIGIILTMFSKPQNEKVCKQADNLIDNN